MRRRLNLQFIENRRARKLSYRKRKNGLLKKSNDLSVLCDVQVCTIVHSVDHPNDPIIWPSPAEAQALVEKFEALPPHKKHVLEHQEFLSGDNKKLKRKLEKQEKANREVELKVLLCKIFKKLEMREEEIEQQLKLLRESTSVAAEASKEARPNLPDLNELPPEEYYVYAWLSDWNGVCFSVLFFLFYHD
ncbi:MADS-box transcription factor 15 [Acorus gramineus]|uniref:MADS-box transcription factor 15 n=1 Tax=Acorus gramineus TaxID=55184 RepID=A0AAV9AEA6_ACOGR|nr:MADS-box transcription factor 15 [Acorus gramineus]